MLLTIPLSFIKKSTKIGIRDNKKISKKAPIKTKGSNIKIFFFVVLSIILKKLTISLFVMAEFFTKLSSRHQQK